MYKIAVIAEKGGVGKTTVAIALAVAAASDGKRSAVIDTDQQATASKWTDRRETEFPWIVATPAARLSAALKTAEAQGADFVVIDTPPHAGTDAAEAARLADLVVIPVEPHLFALETLPKLRDLLKLAGDPLAVVVLNKAAPQGSEAGNAGDWIKQQGFSVCPVVLHLRAAHRHAGNVGQGVTEFEPGSKAAQEVMNLYTYTLKLLEDRTRSHGQAEPSRASA